MNVIDMHCDTIYQLMGDESISLRKNDLCVDIEKLKKGKSKAQFFALFIDRSEHKDANKRFLDMINRFSIEMENNQDTIKLTRNYNEMVKNSEEDKISAFLTIEEGAALAGKMENLKKAYDFGVRLITLTWNYPNEIGYPNISKYMKEGLTEFGIDIVKEMNRLGMIVDVSHLSDGGFYDVVKYSTKPFVASHSNCRAITNHPRNLTDDMIKILSEKGGVMGLNFSSHFLDGSEFAKIDDMIKHVKHSYNIGGIDCISLGTDFDGIGNKVEIENIGQMSKLVQALKNNGFCEDDIDKILYKNSERVIKDVLK